MHQNFDNQWMEQEYYRLTQVNYFQEEDLALCVQALKEIYLKSYAQSPADVERIIALAKNTLAELGELD